MPTWKDVVALATRLRRAGDDELRHSRAQGRQEVPCPGCARGRARHAHRDARVRPSSVQPLRHHHDYVIEGAFVAALAAGAAALWQLRAGGARVALTVAAVGHCVLLVPGRRHVPSRGGGVRRVLPGRCARDPARGSRRGGERRPWSAAATRSRAGPARRLGSRVRRRYEPRRGRGVDRRRRARRRTGGGSPAAGAQARRRCPVWNSRRFTANSAAVAPARNSNDSATLSSVKPRKP